MGDPAGAAAGPQPLSAAVALRCEPFHRFEDIVQEASLAPSGAIPTVQVSYLKSYLKKAPAAARTIIVEQPYVDRHWLEEYTGYYATALHPPPSKATRLHLLRKKLSTEELLALLREAASDGPAKVEHKLAEIYLGFIVVRPLPSAPIGRTVLRPYDDDDARCYEPAMVHNEVHLAGLTLHVDGLPFQQQDIGAGACATAALWTALTKVMRSNGRRPMTPLEITRAANEQGIRSRTFPAREGLTLEQMAHAVRRGGYEPHQLQPAGEDDVFLLALKTYLSSGIPVIARVLLAHGEYHAVTLAGFREWQTLDTRPVTVTVKRRHIVSRGVERFYVHDDRFGPYARLDYDRRGEGGDVEHVLKLAPTEKGYEALVEDMWLHHALVPLYTKLRLTAEELIDFAADAWPPIAYVLDDSDREALWVQPRFCLGGKYLRQAWARDVEPERLVAMVTRAQLSRYVGVLSFFVRDEWFCDLVYDTTDLRRGDASTPPPILVVLARDQGVAEGLKSYAPRAVIA